MNHSGKKAILALLAGLAVTAMVLLSLYALETQAADLATDNPCGVAQVQDGARSHSWAITTVDDWGIAGWHTSLAIEPAAPYTCHISYYTSFPDYNLNYASWNGTKVITRVDTQGIVGHYTSLALELTPPYTPHISYYDYSNGDLKHAWLSGNAWITEIVDSEGNVGSYTSLALETEAPYTPHISYYDVIKGHLKHAWQSDGTWSNEIVDDVGRVGRYTSLALDNNGNPHISYFDRANYDLKYASWDGAKWVKKTVDSAGSVGWYTSLALAPTPPYTPHISYFDRGGNHDLKYAWLSGTTWLSETVGIDNDESVGWYSSLVLETKAPYIPHISYYDFTDGDLKHAWLSGTEWLSETVDSEGNVGRYSSIDLVTTAASSTIICISYYDDTHDALKLACSEINGGKIYLPIVLKNYKEVDITGIICRPDERDSEDFKLWLPQRLIDAYFISWHTTLPFSAKVRPLHPLTGTLIGEWVDLQVDSFSRSQEMTDWEDCELTMNKDVRDALCGGDPGDPDCDLNEIADKDIEEKVKDDTLDRTLRFVTNGE